MQKNVDKCKNSTYNGHKQAVSKSILYDTVSQFVPFLPIFTDIYDVT